MKVWTVILAGLLLGALPHLGSGALEDSGVVLVKNYTKFERRAWPAGTWTVCTGTMDESEWFRFNKFERELQNFEKGKNSMNATMSLGTPTTTLLQTDNGNFTISSYCKYLPKAYHNATKLYSGTAGKVRFSQYPFEYFAVKINGTDRATIRRGWNFITNVRKNRFPEIIPTNLTLLIVETTAAGEIYAGVVQDYRK